MDIRGIWKVKEVRVPTPDGERVFTPDDPPTEERFEGSAQLMQCRTEFAEDGVLNTLMFVPEDKRGYKKKSAADSKAEDKKTAEKKPAAKKKTTAKKAKE